MADRSNFQAAIKKAAKNWSVDLLKQAQKNAPRHIKPHIYTRLSQQSPEKIEILLGVKMVDAFRTNPRTAGALPGAVETGGSMDAAALEFGSEAHDIPPRKRQTKSGRVLKKYSQNKNTWLGVGMMHQRSWLLLPNKGAAALPKDAGKSYRPNLTEDGNFVFVEGAVEHPGSRAYNNGKGYLRPAIQTTKSKMLETEKSSIAKALSMDITDKFIKSSKIIFKEV